MKLIIDAHINLFELAPIIATQNKIHDIRIFIKQLNTIIEMMEYKSDDEE